MLEMLGGIADAAQAFHTLARICPELIEATVDSEAALI